jgi:hypothetical protein
MKHKSLFRPIGIEGLIGFIPLIREEAFLFLRFYESGIYIKGGAINRIAFLDGRCKVGVDMFKGTEHVGQRRDYCLARFTGILFVESRKIPEDGRCGRN